MPVVASYLPKHRLIHAQYSGVVLRNEITDVMLPIYKSEAYVAGSNELTDLRQVTDVNIDFASMMSHAQNTGLTHGKMGPHIKMCFIEGNAVSLGMLRMYQSLIEVLNVNVTVFVAQDEATALSILDVPATSIDGLYSD